jgi:mannose-6-phosphate isomerase-like protein (cupin superfamily)
MLTSIALLLLASASSAATVVPVRPAATVEVLVTDRAGKPLPSASVVVGGTSERQGDTDASGHVTFRNMAAGVYKMTIGRTAFVTLQKEFRVTAGQASVAVQAALSPAPALPPVAASSPAISRASKPAVPIAAAAGGVPRIVSVPDLAETQLLGRDSVPDSLIGCAGSTGAHLLRIDESPTQRTKDVDEVLYVVAGEAILGVAGEAKTIGAGWLTVIPHGTAYSLRRKGHHPAILLSVVGGRECAAP